MSPNSSKINKISKNGTDEGITFAATKVMPSRCVIPCHDIGSSVSSFKPAFLVLVCHLKAKRSAGPSPAGSGHLRRSSLLDLMSRALVFLCCLLSVSLLSFSASPAFALTSLNTSNANVVKNGLVGWWTFDGKNMTNTTATDVSGSGNTGALTSMTKTGSAAAGKIGQALKFNGVDQTVRIPNSASINPSTITVSAWIKVTTPGAFESIFSKDNSGGGTRVWQFRKESGGTVTLIVFRNSDSTNSQAQSSVSVDDGKWHFVTGTWDGTNIKVFVDGVQSGGSTAFSGILKQGQSNDAYIGMIETGLPGFFPGSIDDVRIYNRALTASEIQALYKAGGGVLAATPPGTNNSVGINSGLIGYWTFDGKNMTNTTATDLTGNGNTGTLTNMTATSSVIIGKIGQALNFNGSTNYLSVANSSNFNLSSMSISFWIKPTTSGGSDPGYGLVDKANFVANITDAWGVYYVTGNLIRWRAVASGGAGSGFFDKSVSAPPVNKWGHVVVIWDQSANRSKIYINGVLATNGAPDAGSNWGINANSNPVIIGKSYYNDIYFPGGLDDVRVYNRALSDRDVQSLYKAGGGVLAAATPGTSNAVGINSGLIGYWTFDGKNMTNATATDSSGQGNNGTLTDMTATSSKTIGKIGQGLIFNGSSSISLGTVGQPTNTFAFGGWIKTSATHEIDVETTNSTAGVSGQKYAFDPKHFTDPSAGAGLSIGTNGISVYEHSDGYLCPVSVYSGTIGSGWNHIMVVYNNKVASIYLNGALVHTGVTSVKSTVYAPSYIAGGISNYGNFTGLIDDVRIYNRALSAKEVQSLYKLGAQ